MPASQPPSELAQQIRDRIALLADSLGLVPASITVRPILNWGGFVNRSFNVTDGRSSYHVKLTSDPHAVRGLERWRTLHSILSRNYRAPAMHGWLELPDSRFAGPIFAWIEGTVPERLTGALHREVLDVVRRLHADQDLVSELTGLGDAIDSCAAAYLATYHDRFVQDLEFIHTNRPPFVQPADLDWMAGEAQRLEATVRGSSAFQERAAAASHRDLWLNNILVTRAGPWYLVDWDELALGDPVMDWAMLFGPTRANPNSMAESEVGEVGLSSSETERLSIYARASLLDWIIDPLADWVAAEEEPEFRDQMRRGNQRVHERAVEAYRDRYG